MGRDGAEARPHVLPTIRPRRPAPTMIAAPGGLRPVRAGRAGRYLPGSPIHSFPPVSPRFPCSPCRAWGENMGRDGAEARPHVLLTIRPRRPAPTMIAAPGGLRPVRAGRAGRYLPGSPKRLFPPVSPRFTTMPRRGRDGAGARFRVLPTIRPRRPAPTMIAAPGARRGLRPVRAGRAGDTCPDHQYIHSRPSRPAFAAHHAAPGASLGRGRTWGTGGTGG